MKVAAFLMMLTDVHAVGLKEAQGLTYVTGYYSGLNDRTRHFAKAFEEKFGRPPTMTQASSYSATLDYLKAVAKVGSTDGALVGREMRKMHVSEDVIPSGHIRAAGLLIHDMYLVHVKPPAESKRARVSERLDRDISEHKAYRTL